MIPYGRQEITEDDINVVADVLRSDFLTQGPTLPLFEKAVADYCATDYAIAVNSATSALHIACLALEVGKGDIVWTTPNTFVASANCALYCGAIVDFVDIDIHTLNMSVLALEKKLEEASKIGALPKVLIPVHFAGLPCEMEKISILCSRFGIKIIEDASHAIGARYKAQRVGSCQYSDITVFSFHPVKIITTGEGGMALTNNFQLARKMRLFRSHGITRDRNLMSQPIDDAWYYEQNELGFNYRMTDIQAALGLSQMARLEQYISWRDFLATRYRTMLEKFPLTSQHGNAEGISSWHLYVICLNLKEITKTRSQVFDFLRDKGIGVNVHYIPVHTHPYYQKMGFKLGDFPVAEKYYSQAISLPIFPTLTEQQQDIVIEVLHEAIE